MSVYITARGQYAVETEGYIVVCFASLVDANAYIREQGQEPVYTWFN